MFQEHHILTVIANSDTPLPFFQTFQLPFHSQSTPRVLAACFLLRGGQRVLADPELRSFGWWGSCNTTRGFGHPALTQGQTICWSIVLFYKMSSTKMGIRDEFPPEKTMTSGPWSWRSFSTLGANCLPLPSWYIWDGAKWSDGGGTGPGDGRCGWPGCFAWYRIHWHFFCMRREGYSFLPGFQNLGIKWAKNFKLSWVRVGVIHNRVNRLCIYTRTHRHIHSCIEKMIVKR